MQQNNSPSLRYLLDRAGAALFDFDGVIADTEQYHARSFAKLLADHDISLGQDEFQPYVGKSETQIYEMLRLKYGIELDSVEVREARSDYVIEAAFSANLQPYPFVYSVLSYLDRAGAPAFIVSSDASSFIRTLLAHWSLQERFAALYTVPDLGNLATKPELIALVPSLIQYRPEQLIVFEDSREIIDSARRLGMNTVGVVSSMNKTIQLGADVIIDASSYGGTDLIDRLPR